MTQHVPAMPVRAAPADHHGHGQTGRQARQAGCNCLATLAGLYRAVRAQLRARQVEDPSLDARCLIAHACATGAMSVYTTPERPVTAAEAGRALWYATQRGARVPMARIVGTKPFRAQHIIVEPGVFEPRSDSETLVAAVLDRIDRTHGRTHPLRFADICTGSGAIGVALLAELPNACAILSDICTAATICACKNTKSDYIEHRVLVARSCFCDHLAGKLDFIVANPPYIPSGQIAFLETEVRCHDPVIALDGGQDGCDAFRTIIRQAGHCLAHEGFVFLETGCGQAAEIAAILDMSGFVNIRVEQDLAGHDRVIVAQRPSDTG